MIEKHAPTSQCPVHSRANKISLLFLQLFCELPGGQPDCGANSKIIFLMPLGTTSCAAAGDLELSQKCQ